MLLAVDIGNTRIKAAVFEQDELLQRFAFSSDGSAENLENMFSRFGISSVVTSSVAGTLRNLPVPVHQVTRDWKFPFTNKYGSPETLGVDRMILSAGAVFQYPETARLVIDAGTCITYDFVDSDDNYIGGAISPGLRMRYSALHEHTAKLPLLAPSDHEVLIGDTTAASIHSGVVNGTVNEIDGFIERYAQTQPNFIIILTGGDSEFLAERLKNRIFAEPNFLLTSLNRTFQYQSLT